ncbi:MAG: Kdo hydroxylase family protein, partial [Stellaceae bacterium]
MNDDEILATLPIDRWGGPFAAELQAEAVAALETGRVVLLPRLGIAVGPDEAPLLDPAAAGAARKNVSFDPATGAIGNSALDAAEAARLKSLMARFAEDAARLVRDLVPGYADALEVGRTSFRPLEIAGRDYSPRHDDRRLHVDAFPSRPGHGRRILRLFTNIAPDGAARHWRVGEPFADFARRFVPRIGRPPPGSAWFLAASGVTKGRRSRYDHLMLKLHDGAKLDPDYQRAAPKYDVTFPAGSTWLVFTDQVLHAMLDDIKRDTEIRMGKSVEALR